MDFAFGSVVQGLLFVGLCEFSVNCIVTLSSSYAIFNMCDRRYDVPEDLDQANTISELHMGHPVNNGR